MRVCISIGNYATNPYTIPGLEISVYCIEELCYLLGENAVLLDQTIMRRELVEWIEKECGLVDLARELYPMVQRAGSLSGFVCLILEYTGLNDGLYIENVRRTLKRGAGLSAIERHKKQIDYLVEKKRYASAIRGYRNLIEKWDSVSKDHSSVLPGLNVLSAIHHNLGVAYAGLMLYDRAARSFEDAYKLDGDRRHFSAYLAAKRMGMTESEYIAFVGDAGNSGNAGTAAELQELEKNLQRLQRDWYAQGDAHRLSLRKNIRNNGNAEEIKNYEEENERILKALKDSYRENVSIFEQG
ncbi:MAG: hypothetical protein MJ104_03630 [Lachnospiraceae bacterium]|nr:hypothetical protein [Lachnospiraceae bacterium]